MRSRFRRCRALAVAWAVAFAAPVQGQTTIEFRVPSGFPVGGTPSDVAANDFDRDGALDLAVANVNVGTLTVLLGSGDGDFFPLDDTFVSAAPTEIAVAHFDGDEALDLIVTETESDYVHLLRGNGDGTFAAPTEINVGHDPAAISVVDMNEDGELDLVIGLAAEGAGRVNVLLGAGDGTFSLDEEERGRRLSASCYGVGVGDFTGDDNLDVVGLTADGTISSLIGDGTGALARPTLIPASDLPLRLAVFDFNGDGPLDLLTADGGQNAVSMWRGDGTGLFAKQASFATGAGPSSVQLADLDGDGRNDAFTSDTAGGTISVLRGLPDGSFAPARHFSAPLRPFAAVSGDFDGDDRLDIVAVATSDFTDQALLLRGLPDGFEAVEALYPGTFVSGAAAGDMTGDGVPDLVASGGANVELRASVPGRGFATPTVVSAGRAGPIRLADLDRDGHLDVIAASFEQANVRVSLGHGDGSFTAAPSVSVLAPVSAMAVADLDGDGAVDLAAPSDTAGAMAVAYGNGDGTFTESVRIEIGGRPGSIASGDFDGDRRGDLAVGNLATGLVNVLLSRDQRTFDATRTQAIDGLPFAITAGDVDGDGHDDLAVAGNGPVRLYFGNGDGTFGSGQSVSQIGLDVALRDVTGDLLPDVLIANLTGNSVVAVPNLGGRRFGTPVSVVVGLRPTGVVAADFEGDGRYDVVGRGTGAWVLTNTAAVSSRRGDANGDGAIGAADLTPLAHALALSPSQEIERAARVVGARGGLDANGDGTVEPSDTTALLRRLFGA